MNNYRDLVQTRLDIKAFGLFHKLISFVQDFLNSYKTFLKCRLEIF